MRSPFAAGGRSGPLAGVFGILLALALAAMLVGPASAQPPPVPMTGLYGAVTDEQSNPVAAGTAVYSVMDGVVVAAGAVDPGGGAYGGLALYSIPGTRADEGKEVTFYIGGAPSLGQTPAQAGGELATTDPTPILWAPGNPGYAIDLTLGVPPPPAVTTLTASPVSATAATLRGALDSLGHYPSVDVSFEWGTASGALDQVTILQSRTSTGTFTSALSGLSSSTTYFFTAKAEANGQVVYGAEMSFTTSPTPTPGPSGPGPQPSASPTQTPEPTVEPTPTPTVVETPPPFPTEEEVNLPVDEGGELQGDVSHSGFDGTIGVDIGDGTVAQTAGGEALPTITIREAALVYPDPNAGDCILPPAYELLPTGATFDPAITVTLDYDEGLLPAICPGVAEESLAIAMYKDTVGIWQVLPSTVDTVNNVITAEVSSFCYLAVYAEGPEPTPTTHGPAVSVSPSTGPPDTEVMIQGTGFAPNGEITIVLGNHTYPAGTTADSTGAFAFTGTVPTLPPGAHVLQASDGIQQATASFTVTELPSPEPGTIPWHVVGGSLAGILILGASALYAVRRRRKDA